MTTARLPRAWDPAQYELIDAGDGRRLERLGSLVLDRPAPAARGRALPGWQADARFEREAAGAGRWLPRTPVPWTVSHGALELEARATPSGGVGVFPEQVDTWAWLAERVHERGDDRDRPVEVLNLFAHTGAATLAAALAGAHVAHVDASRPAIAWARRNADRSGLGGAHIRWLVDDALAFTRREGRRGRRYDVVVLDPPSYGHGPNAARWQLEDALPGLLEACAAIVAPDGAVALSAHTPGYTGERLADALCAALGVARGAVEVRDLCLVAAGGARLPAGSAARVDSRS